MATAAGHQDMPPEGGYRPINYARIPAKKYFGGKVFLLPSSYTKRVNNMLCMSIRNIGV